MVFNDRCHLLPFRTSLERAPVFTVFFLAKRRLIKTGLTAIVDWKLYHSPGGKTCNFKLRPWRLFTSSGRFLFTKSAMIAQRVVQLSLAPPRQQSTLALLSLNCLGKFVSSCGVWRVNVLTLWMLVVIFVTMIPAGIILTNKRYWQPSVISWNIQCFSPVWTYVPVNS